MISHIIKKWALISLNIKNELIEHSLMMSSFYMIKIYKVYMSF